MLGGGSASSDGSPTDAGGFDRAGTADVPCGPSDSSGTGSLFVDNNVATVGTVAAAAAAAAAVHDDDADADICSAAVVVTTCKHS